ncbi:acetate/propionate family kinase [Limnohabitans sp. TEGF004]|jgi:acetate kinase|uniref:acetate/propionate family kinase n=1 Tax=Limnohabitans sp. TEGF004 TaxID=2986281 RepID=UPI0023776ED5|nr:acetate/propionate family kinase [Limnohabitans sp. TEGF004]BDU54804.1 acetate kinase [Limnohabitans sp. TEGF004]
MSILSVNAGSSSLKFALYPIEGAGIGEAEVTGNIEGLEPSGEPRICMAIQGQGKEITDVCVMSDQEPFEAALEALDSLLALRFSHLRVQAIAHRVVHGGAFYSSSVRVTPEVMAQLATLNALAPLHQPHNLAGISAFAESFPDVPQVACFDTAFHRTLSPLETTFAIDKKLTEQGVRRYGFHGLSYQYVSQVLQREVPRSAGRVVMAHLGNGASVCATTDHQSRATTMGFSALDGLMMGTRSGALDPGVLLYLMEQGWDHDAIQKLLYKQSGLLGVSGESADMRTLRASQTEAARFATDLFAHRVVREVGALSACIGGLDVLAFTGGIGEHDAVLRQQVGDALAYLGVQVDAARNAKATGDHAVSIHADNSAIEVWVIPTDEGRVAAQDALAFL